MLHQALIQTDYQAQRTRQAGNFERATGLYKQAIGSAEVSGRTTLLAALLLRLGQVQEEAGEIQDAVITYETGYKAWAQEEGLELEGVLRDLSAMPKMFAEAPEDEASLPDLFPVDAEADLEAVVQDRLLGVKLRLGIGNAYLRMGQDGPAKHALEQTLTMPELQTSAASEAQVLTHIAVILRRAGDLEKAKRRFNKALKLLDISQTPLEKRRVLAGLAGIDVAQKRNGRAQKRYQQALELYRQVDDPLGEGRCRASLGLLLLQQDEHEAAEDMFEEALILAERAQDDDTRWWVHWGLGRCYREHENLKKAAWAFERSLKLIEKRHWQLRTDEGKVSFLESVQVMFDELIALHLEAKDYEAALGVAERSRGRSLDVLMQGRQRHRPLKLPTLPDFPSEQELWQALRSLLPTLPEQLIPDVLQRLVDPYTPVAEGGYLLREMAPAIETNADLPPEVWALLTKFKQLQPVEGAPAVDIRQSAPASQVDTLALEMDVAPPKQVPPLDRLVFHVLEDKTAVFVVKSGGGTWGYTLAMAKEDLMTEVSELRQVMKVDEARASQRLTREIDAPPLEHSFADPSDRLRRLYDLLVLPLESHLPGYGRPLVIEPHDFLWLLPFAALKLPDDSYLAERWPFHYSPAHQVLEEIRREHDYGAVGDLKALIVGNPTMPDAITLDGQALRLTQLEGAQGEAEAIHKLFPADQSRLLTAYEATREKVLTAVPEAGILHFATHGVAHSAKPLDSFVVLAGQQDEALLTARDIMRLPCPAELVVLSACQTGLGQVSGEGIIGFSRAFLIAGARGVLVSQWSVDDEATKELMISFYQHYLEQNGKGAALQSAMKALRNNPAYTHPRYWAAFGLVGV